MIDLEPIFANGIIYGGLLSFTALLIGYLISSVLDGFIKITKI